MHAENCITDRPFARQYHTGSLVAAPFNKPAVCMALRRFALVFTFTLYARPTKRHSSTCGLSLQTTNRPSKTQTLVPVKYTRSVAGKKGELPHDKRNEHSFGIRAKSTDAQLFKQVLFLDARFERFAEHIDLCVFAVFVYVLWSEPVRVSYVCCHI